MGRVLWRINENEFVTTRESPWFFVHMVMMVSAGAAAWESFEDGYTTLGLGMLSLAIISGLTSLEVRDRRLP